MKIEASYTSEINVTISKMDFRYLIRMIECFSKKEIRNRLRLSYSYELGNLKLFYKDGVVETTLYSINKMREHLAENSLACVICPNKVKTKKGETVTKKFTLNMINKCKAVLHEIYFSMINSMPKKTKNISVQNTIKITTSDPVKNHRVIMKGTY